MAETVLPEQRQAQRHVDKDYSVAAPHFTNLMPLEPCDRSAIPAPLLIVGASKMFKRINREGVMLVLAGLFIGAMLGKIVFDRMGGPETPETLHGVARPYHGLIEASTVHPRVAPFRIITPPGSRAYVVKLVDAQTNQAVMRIFLEPGRTFETLAPIGSFDLQWATGRDWQGENQLFGPLTDYQKAVEPLVFGVDRDGYSGHTIELKPKVDGNLYSDSINPTDF